LLALQSQAQRHLMMSTAFPTPLALAGAIAMGLAIAISCAATPVAFAQDAAASGQAKAAQCIGCHGIPSYQSSFPEVYKVPKISGQNGKYVVAALNAYKKGERKHPTMRSVAAGLSDKDMAELAAFYEGHGASPLKTVAASTPAQPPAEVGALLARGACVSCHGADFNKPIDAAYPKLAGQHPDYLFAALRAYGTEGNPQVGRANAIMSGQVKQFKRSELKAIAEYLATLPGDVRTEPQSRFK